MLKSFPLLSVLLCSVALMACSFNSAYQRPDVAQADGWKGTSQTEDAIDAQWWSNYNSSDLNSFIAQASKQNTDINAALARIDQARAQVKIAGGPLLPNVTGNANTGITDGNRVSSIKSYGGGVAVAYELDLWGRLRNTRDAARKNLNTTAFDKDALSLSITAETAQTYFNTLALQQRIANAEKNLNLSKDVARLIETRHEAGAASGQDVAQQNTAIATSEATLSSLRQQLSNSFSALNVLLGQPPQTSLPAFTTALEKVTVPVIAPLQPVSLLERRPDLRAQEEFLKAADINIAIARASFYPRVTLGLNGTFGASPLSAPLNIGLGLTAGLTAPIFNNGQLQGELDLNTARKRELAENYKGAVLTAFQESEEALAAITAATERKQSLLCARDESRRYYDIAHERYISGADDFLTLLDAQRTLIQAEDTYIQAQLDRLTASLALFKAMGGGWNSSSP
jgi:multidrug efflux system outer membrane protein